MPNPLHIEKAFQQTVSDIDTALSYRYIYARFFDFVELIEGEHRKYQSYLVQLLAQLPVFDLPIMWSGLDPALLSRYADSIETISEEIKRKPPGDVVNRLRQAAFIQYTCISEPTLAADEFEKFTGHHLHGDFAPVVPGEESRKNLLAVKKWLVDIINHQKVVPGKEKLLRKCISDIHHITQERQFCITIPVVEFHTSTERDETGYYSGRLRSLSLHESGAAEESDQLIRYFPISGAEPVSEIRKRPVTEIPRALAEQKYPQLAGAYYRAHLYYEINGANHEGDSSDIAVSALWFTYLIEKAESREHIRLTDRAAITGTLSEEGEVRRVDEEGIQWKVKAAFFSWIDYLVVPMSQYPQFEEQLKSLQKAYPGRKCILIGVKSIEELFYDRRLTHYHYESQIKYSLNKFKREKFKVIGIPFIILLLLVIARLMYGPIDQNPASITFVDNFFEVKNSDGIILKRLSQGSGPDSYISKQGLLFDVNGDSYNELIYDFSSEEMNNGNPVLKAWTARGDSVLWQTAIQLNYNYPRQLIPEFTNVRVIEIGIGQSAEGPRVIVNARSTQYFQGLILIYDAESGELISEYLNPGIITDLFIEDRNGDGITEVVFVGVNNAYWRSFVAEIDIDDGHGYSPSTKDYIPEGISKADEKVYALLPKSVIAAYLTPVDKYNFARDLRYDSQRSEYLVIVQEGRRYFDGEMFGVDVLFHFDHSIKPTGIGTSDVYDVAARDFFQEKKIPFEPDYDYFEALQDSILYWTGEEFVPTQNYFSNENE